MSPSNNFSSISRRELSVFCFLLGFIGYNKYRDCFVVEWSLENYC